MSIQYGTLQARKPFPLKAFGVFTVLVLGASVVLGIAARDSSRQASVSTPLREVGLSNQALENSSAAIRERGEFIPARAKYPSAVIRAEGRVSPATIYGPSMAGIRERGAVLSVHEAAFLENGTVVPPTANPTALIHSVSVSDGWMVSLLDER